MTIGQALKQYRLREGKTQSEMAVGLMSESFYSKVERGVHKIDADLLIELLERNNIGVTRFFQTISVKPVRRSPNVTFEYDDISHAANRRDIAALKKMKKEADNADDISQLVKLHIDLSLATAERSDKDITPELKRKLKQIISESGWDTLSYDFLSESMAALDIDDAYQLFHSAILNLKKQKEFNLMEANALSVAAINFLNNCYHKHGKRVYVDEAIDFIYSLPASVQVMFGSFFATYYQALFNHDDKTLDACVLVFKKSKYYQILQDTYEDYQAKKKSN